ncbi:N-6 DNA methylase [Streptococcus mutans]|uniref:N-6 DNA methylase n=1 Tax=Streptococcus mutans TaxID=1309 RepID=UPI0002B5680E|nr:N-6 DNA methylase [Streptococcus mutans]EMB73705.1 type II restriction-modification system modification subunit [Streptococcus mutans 4VF1]EMC30512.1 type II restriction-modification system modification subunit [Streptococcus mutans NLML1]MCB5097393.1 N-6 DNA methylase [Streptococcus mutans]MDT9563831.1 N-6 DNA methylase [Streptococcus mutans]MDT9576261.1 N-6 DNA methylase [Streptococcus mutans]
MSRKLIKSKKRVQKHGEVFTPSWVVNLMLDQVERQTDDIYATFLEPAAGEGAFLTAILERKLKSVTKQYDKHYWKTKSLFALASIYGIELLEDNLYYARQNLLDTFITFHKNHGYKISKSTNLYKAADFIIQKNIVWGNTLMRLRPDGEAITFSEWRRVKGYPSQVERIPFTYSSLFEEKSKDGQLDLFEVEGQLNLFEDEHVGEAKKYKIVDILHVFKGEME